MLGQNNETWGKIESKNEKLTENIEILNQNNEKLRQNKISV